jgi:hypothetical protein
MNDTELVDAMTEFWLNVGSSLTADDTTVRARNTFFAQQAVSEFWHWKPWSWKQRVDNVTVTDGEGDLPDDFGTIGQQGSVLIHLGGPKLKWVPAQYLIHLQELQQSTSGNPRLYTITGLASMAEGTPLIKVYPISTATLIVYYDAKSPTVDYATPAALEQIPAQYHETVLFDLACSRLAFGEGDPRAIELRQNARRAMAEAWAEERPGVSQARRRGMPYGRGFGARYLS